MSAAAASFFRPHAAVFPPDAHGVFAVNEALDELRRCPLLTGVIENPPQNGGIQRVFVGGGTQRIVFGQRNDSVPLASEGDGLNLGHRYALPRGRTATICKKWLYRRSRIVRANRQRAGGIH